MKEVKLKMIQVEFDVHKKLKEQAAKRGMVFKAYMKYLAEKED